MGRVRSRTLIVLDKALVVVTLVLAGFLLVGMAIGMAGLLVYLLSLAV